MKCQLVFFCTCVWGAMVSVMRREHRNVIANMSCISYWLETSWAWDALHVCVWVCGYDVVERDKDM